MILSERRLISWNCNANTNMSLIWDQQRCPLSNESFCHIAFLFNLLISFAINSGGNTSAGMLDTKCPCESHLLWVLDLCVVFLFSSGVVPCIAVGWKKGNSEYWSRSEMGKSYEWCNISGDTPYTHNVGKDKSLERLILK